MRTTYKTLLATAAALVPALSFAQTQLTYGRPIGEALTSVQYFIGLLNIIIPSLAVVLFFALIAKFIWVKVYGDGKVEGKSLFWGLVALTVLFGTYGLIRLMASFVGVNTDGSTRITAPALPSQAR